MSPESDCPIHIILALVIVALLILALIVILFIVLFFLFGPEILAFGGYKNVEHFSVADDLGLVSDSAVYRVLFNLCDFPSGGMFFYSCSYRTW